MTSGRGADHVLLVAGGHPPTARWRPPPSWPATARVSSTSARRAWTCRGTPTTTRNWTSGSPGRTGPAGMTTGTSWRASTIRPATSAGPSGATWSASWTSSRARTIEVESLISGIFPIENAAAVYDDLASGALPAVGVLLEYPKPERRSSAACGEPGGLGRPGRPRRAARSGASWRSGSSARATTPRRCCCRTWPRTRAVRLAHVATTRSLSAVNAQQRFGFTTASTSADAVLEDKSLDAIFIVTRHHTHADLVCRALETGKTVFVEKPLALTSDELERILDVVEKTGNDRLMVGFNRRFAPLLTDMRVAVRPAGQQLGDPVPGERGTAGRRQLVPQRGAGRVAVHRRGRPLHRHAQLVGGQPARGGLRRARRRPGRRAGHRALRQRGERDHQLCHDRQLPLPQGDAGRRSGRQQRAARQLRGGLRLDRPASAAPAGRAAARTRASVPRWSSSSRRSGPVLRCPSRSTRW